MNQRLSDKERSQRMRIRIVEILFALFAFAIVWRALDLNIRDDSKLNLLAKREYERYVVLSPQRGNIFDRSGKNLASSVTAKSIYANPRQIKDKGWTAGRLALATGQAKSPIMKKLRQDKCFVWISRKVSPEVYRKVEALKIEGVGALDESNRFYPNVELASNVIGFTGLDSNGLGGIELKYEKFLKSEESRFTGIHDALGRTLFTDGFFVKEYSKGKDVYLTLDSNIQYISETELDGAMTSSRAARGYAIVMEPSTGRILAMVSRPRFNPNNLKDSDPAGLLNGTVSLAYEPGSTMKVFVIAGAVEDKILSPSDLFWCKKGSYEVSGKVIKDSADKAWLDPASIIKYSSNIGAAKIAALLGKQRLYGWFKAFGFGNVTGIELPGEATGLLSHYSKWRSLDLATMGFGQGIAASPLQMITALSAIANGGNLVRPYIIEKIEDPQGKQLLVNGPRTVGRVISEKTASLISDYMVGVTGPDGTGFKAKMEGFSVAGKTGTAQKIDPATGEYTFEKMVSSFMGFVPADKPEIAILVILDEPVGIDYGGLIAAPVFRRIAERTLKYMKIMPQKRIDLKMANDLDYRTPAEDGLTLVSMQKGRDYGEGSIPDFEGLGIREALRISERKGMEISVKGSGVAFRQSMRPGTKIAAKAKCTVWFRPI